MPRFMVATTHLLATTALLPLCACAGREERARDDVLSRDATSRVLTREEKAHRLLLRALDHLTRGEYGEAGDFAKAALLESPGSEAAALILEYVEDEAPPGGAMP